MVGDWAHTPSIALLLARILRGLPVAMWVDTPQEQLYRPLWKRIPRSIFLRWVSRRVDVVFGSGIPARRALVGLGAPLAKIRDFQFSVDLEIPIRAARSSVIQKRTRQLRNSFSRGPVQVVFGMSGTIDLAKKGQDIGLRAFAKCAEEVGAGVGMIVSGDGPDLRRLRKLASVLEVYDRVRFLGWQEPEEMKVFYGAIDVFVHTANYDPFPLVVIEAMSWGCPVVGTKTSGSVQERVEEGINGFSTSPGDVDKLAQAMKSFAENLEFLEFAKKNAREKAEEWPISRLVELTKLEMNICTPRRADGRTEQMSPSAFDTRSARK